jgi:hypothetical protein
MSEDDPKAREEARRRLTGRVAVILLGLLVLVYLVPLALKMMRVF